MKKNKAVLVAVSALALSVAVPVSVFGQIVVNCPQSLRVGTHATCSAGTLVIDADGTANLTGCLITTVAPVEARCFISAPGVPPTRSVVVDFPQAFVNLANGTKTMRLDDFKMIHTGTATSAAQFTFSTVDVINKVTVDIGGTITFSDGQALGGYTGNVTVRADLI